MSYTDLKYVLRKDFMKKLQSLFCTFFFTLLFTLSLFFSLSTPINAQTVVFQDDFSGDLSKWENPRGNPQLWTTSNEQAKAYVPGPFDITEMVPTDSNWTISSKNAEIEFDFTPLTGQDKNFSFNFQDLNNWSEFHFTGSIAELLKVVNGNAVFSQQLSNPLSNGNTYHMRLVLTETNLKLYVDNNILFDVTDPYFSGLDGKFGMKAGTGAVFPTSVLFDNVVVKDLDKKILDVPYQSQQDDQWKNLELDHAFSQDWGYPETIGNYGCALTSMTMLLNYYGYTKVPTGENLTPETFNTYLNDNNGFSNGLIKWEVAASLTEKLATVSADPENIPQLEYISSEKNSVQLKNEITEDRPLILHVDNDGKAGGDHFVVGTGYDKDENYYMQDPYYPDEKQLSKYGNTYLTGRKFVPSHTNLSYLSLYYTNPNLFIKIFKNGSLVKDSTDALEDAINLPEDSTDPGVVRYGVLLEKPESGAYSLEISNPNGGVFDIDLTTIATDGAVFSTPLSGTIDQYDAKYTVEFDKDTGDTVVEAIPTPTPTPTPTPEPTATPTPIPYVDFRDFVKELNSTYQDHEIRYQQYRLLKNLAFMGEIARKDHLKEVFAQVIEIVLLHMNPRFITESAREHLLEQINLVQQNL